MKSWLIILLTVILCPVQDVWAEIQPTSSPIIILPERDHPYLFLNRKDFARLARMASSEEHAWAGQHYKNIIQTADAALEAELQIPRLPGEWSHHYVCKKCGIRLQAVEDMHQCPRCNKIYTGWPYDGVAAGIKHAQNIAGAQNLGLAWQLTGNRGYADRVLEILTAYAGVYTEFPIHDFKGGKSVTGARLTAQTLDESVRMISAAWAYDLVADSPGATEQVRELIENNLLRPAAGVIRRNDKGISNWQSWHNAALAAIGFVLEDAELVNHAVNGPSGIKFQMKESVLDDGFWYEGTASYHFYALNALQQQVIAMKAAGMDFYKNPVFRSMYQAPLDYMFPDGSFPAVNDSSPVPVSHVGNHYELAYAWYGDPQYAALAKRGERRALEAFLWGAEKLPENAVIEPGSKNFSGLGAVMLRQNSGSDDAMAVHLDYGPHGGGHGHNDKLGIIFFVNGHEVMPDAGRLDYGAPLHERWYKRSIAHNTVIVDGKDQAATEGELIATDFSGPIQLATAVCHSVYKDVKLTRSLALAPDYLLDVVSGASSGNHTWDLACHVYGQPDIKKQSFKAITLPQQSHGYQVLKNVRTGTVDHEPNTFGTEGVSITFDADSRGKGSLGLKSIGNLPGQLILADGLAGEGATTCPMVLIRHEGVNNPVWITLINPREGEQDIKLTAHHEADGWHVTVKSAERTDKYVVRRGQLHVAGLGAR